MGERRVIRSKGATEPPSHHRAQAQAKRARYEKKLKRRRAEQRNRIRLVKETW